MRRLVLVIMVAAFAMAQSPQGWKMRIDHSASASDPDAAGEIKFVTSGAGFHATNPAAASYWNPSNTVTGNYTLKGTFTLMKPSGHTNYYGLVFGGSALDGAEQSYTYFLVAQNGTWLVKKMNGASAVGVFPKTPNDAIKKPDDTGKSTNALKVRVGAQNVDFVVNGTVVKSAPRADIKTDGIYGIRVNHLLEVQVDGFAMSK